LEETGGNVREGWRRKGEKWGQEKEGEGRIKKGKKRRKGKEVGG